jgi:SAM-dependent methyltransferase
VPGQIDLRDYWESRLSDDFSLEATGYVGLGQGFNRWSYRVQRRVFLRAVRPLVANRSVKVLDIGSGTGFWIERWRELGAREITGSDLTSKSVATLAERFPEADFVQFDAGGEDRSAVEARGPFDIVSAIAVLYHITDDASFERAFHNIAAVTAEGGHMVFSDNFVADGARKSPHQAVRLGSEIERIVSDAGFEIVSRHPLFVLTNTPVNSDSRALHRWWDWFSARLRRSERAGSIGGAALYPAELAAVSLARRAPSLELVVCRKR